MKLVDSNRFYLPGTNNRYLHLATLHNGIREYMCFAEVGAQKIYIEEITGGSLQFIEDEALAGALHEFLREAGVLDINKPLLPDKVWQKLKPNATRQV